MVSTMPAKTLLAAAAIAGAVLGAAAQPAAAKPRTATFMASFEASYTTTWNEPKRLTGGSVCGGLNYQQGSGEETWTIKTRKPQKLLAYKTSYGVGFQHSTWDPNGDGGNLEASGRHTRNGRSYWTTEPGTCGGTFEVEPKDPDEDCGTRLPEYDLFFMGTKKYHPELTVAGHMRREKLHFDDCDIRLADALTQGAWPKVEKRITARQVFGGRRTVKITGSKAWDNADEPTADRWTTSSTLTWTLTLTRR